MREREPTPEAQAQGFSDARIVPMVVLRIHESKPDISIYEYLMLQAYLRSIIDVFLIDSNGF